MQVLALLSGTLAIHPVVVAVPEVHRLVPNGPFTSPRSRRRSRVPRALVVLEPAFPTMLTLSSLGILPAGPISRPSRRLPPRRLGRRGTLVPVTTSSRRCSPSDCSSRAKMTLACHLSRTLKDLGRSSLRAGRIFEQPQELQDVDPSHESEIPIGISAHGRSDTSEACSGASAIARHSPDKLYTATEKT